MHQNENLDHQCMCDKETIRVPNQYIKRHDHQYKCDKKKLSWIPNHYINRYNKRAKGKKKSTLIFNTPMGPMICP